MATTAEHFGTVLSQWRGAANVSQTKLAATSDLTRSHLSDLEMGYKNVTLPTLLRLAAALDRDPAELVREVHERILDDPSWRATPTRLTTKDAHRPDPEP